MQELYYNDSLVMQTLWEYTKKLDADEENDSVKTKFMDDPLRVLQHSTWLMLQHFYLDAKKVIYYYKIMLENTEKFSKKEKVAVITEMNPFIDIEESRNLLINGFDSPESAQNYLDKNTAFYELVPHLEAIAIEFIIKLPIDIAENEITFESLIERLEYLSNTYRDIRIKSALLRSWLEHGPNKIEEFDAKVRNLYTMVKNPPKQLDEINPEVEKVYFIKILIQNYFTSASEIRFYFEDLLTYLFNEKPNSRVGSGLIAMAHLAYDICEKYYDQHDLDNGDIFHLRIDLVAAMFMPSVPPPVSVLKSRAMSKRVRIFKDIVNF